jgi:hypothetical protein
MTEHSRSLSELHGTAQTRADEAALSRVELSELQAVTGGSDMHPWDPKIPPPSPPEEWCGNGLRFPYGPPGTPRPGRVS